MILFWFSAFKVWSNLFHFYISEIFIIEDYLIKSLSASVQVKLNFFFYETAERKLNSREKTGRKSIGEQCLSAILTWNFIQNLQNWVFTLSGLDNNVGERDTLLLKLLLRFLHRGKKNELIDYDINRNVESISLSFFLVNWSNFLNKES